MREGGKGRWNRGKDEGRERKETEGDTRMSEEVGNYKC